MKKIRYMYILTFLIYAFVNILSINTFPFVHSDEVWLAGLSYTIRKSGTFVVTEPFFTLFPRQPHAIKSLFHWIQGSWISLFGYSITSVRALSLTVSFVVILCLYMYFSKKVKTNKTRVSDFIPLLSVALMASSIQYLYASHFGRQEIFILFFMLLTYIVIDLYIVNQKDRTALGGALIASVITGLAIGFHPNSFLIGCVAGLLLLYDGVIHKRLKPLLAYIGMTGIIAGGYVFVSTMWNQSFIQDYNTFGDSLGATLSFMDKLATFPLFLYKLYHQISATYYTPDIRAEMILFALVFTLALSLIIYRWASRKVHTPVLAMPVLGSIGIFAGLVVIGRYNATSIVFLLPFMALMTFGILITLSGHTGRQVSQVTSIILVFLIGLLTFKSVQVILQPQLETYDDYSQHVTESIESDGNVLCNLNAGFAFEPDHFRDFRDLGYLNQANMSVTEYLIENDIKYVVLPEEMDYIYRNQDRWDILYGDMSYYPLLLNELESDFELIHSFESPQYGMRIPLYNDGYPWNVSVYKRK